MEILSFPLGDWTHSPTSGGVLTTGHQEIPKIFFLIFNFHFKFKLQYDQNTTSSKMCISSISPHNDSLVKMCKLEQLTISKLEMNSSKIQPIPR